MPPVHGNAEGSFLNRSFLWGFLIAACALPGCNPKPREYDIEHIKTPIDARLHVVAVLGNASIVYRPFVKLTVAGAEIALPCVREEIPREGTKGLLAVDPAGTRIAFRCKTTEPYTLRYFASDTLIEPCQANRQLPSPTLDWTAIPTLEDAAIPLLQCYATDFGRLAVAFEARGGKAALGRFVRAAAALKDIGGPVGEEAFLKALPRLGEDDRADITRTLRSAMEDASSPIPMARAGNALSTLGELPKEPETLRKALDRCPGTSIAQECVGLLRAYARAAPRPASELACTRFANENPSNTHVSVLAAWANASVRCDAWAKAMEAENCALLTAGRSCPGAAGLHPCKPEEYRDEIAAELALQGAAAFPTDGFGHQARMRTAAGIAMGVACAEGKGP